MPEDRLGRAWRKAQRRRLWKVQKRCRWCRRRFSDPVSWRGENPIWVIGQLFPTLDHIISLGEGGSNDEDNLTLACKSCNSRRNSH